MIEYVCPLCGSRVEYLVLTVNPPIHRYYCTGTGCSYLYERTEGIERVVAPLPKESTK